MTDYCKNCNNVIRKWNYKHEYYENLAFCKFRQSKNINSIFFLDCENCNKFVGIICWRVCKICFGKNELTNEKKLFNWFQKYKKIINNFNYDICKKCNEKDFRYQIWFFKELTFYKQ